MYEWLLLWSGADVIVYCNAEYVNYAVMIWKSIGIFRFFDYYVGQL